MTDESLKTFTSYAGIFGILFGMLLIAYDDKGVQFALFKKIRCKVGWHKIHKGIGKLKTKKYYCQFCKKPRKHPQLKIIDGGNKLGYNKYKFF